jgi:hypothetical protein
MPNRMVREGILSSDKIKKLSWPGEVFFRRLMSVADDFGRYDGRSEIIRAALYPLILDKVSAADVDKWKAECAEAGLVSCYRVEKKEYIQIDDFGQRLRSKKSKYPAPLSSDSKCQRMSADGGAVRLEEKRRESEEESEEEGEFTDDSWNKYPKTEDCGELNPLDVGNTAQFIALTRQTTLTEQRVKELWTAFTLTIIGEKFYNSRAELVHHFRNWLKGQKFDEPFGKQQSKSETSVSDQIKAARAKNNA